MRQDNMPVSGRLQDRTGWTPAQDVMQDVANKLNPVYAYRVIREQLINRGMVDPFAGGARIGGAGGLPRIGGR